MKEGAGETRLVLDPRDNVAVALRPLPSTCQHATEIPPGHKQARIPIEPGDRVIKFGQVIGQATAPIPAGGWVHSHNVSAEALTLGARLATDWQAAGHAASTAGVHDRVAPAAPAGPLHSGHLSEELIDWAKQQTFLGIRRASGQVATRNYLAVISNVNCSASVCKAIARRFDAAALAPYPNIDGVVALTHTGGCAMEYDGLNHLLLDRVLAGYARHANIAGYVLIGLGCETGTLGHLVNGQRLVQLALPGESARPPLMLSMQDCGGTRNTIEEGTRLVASLLPAANEVRRVPVSSAELVLGTNCGGSDGYSGITANPLLGIASDLLVAAGGTSVLAETTEIYGAEALLLARAATPAVGEKLLERIRWWEWYSGIFGCTPDNNPSPGNKAGGLSTILEKSLGAVMKGGSSPLKAVYEYAQPIDARGFVFMDTPGFDPTSVTGLVAGGCNLVAFTTGRGSCFGCKPVPSFKIASTSALFQKMTEDMDWDAGRVLQQGNYVALGQELFQELLDAASGKPTKSELLGIGDEEFSPWNIGPIL